MGDEEEQTPRIGGHAPPAAHADGAAAPDITVPAADPFASTLTVAVGPAPLGPRLEPGRELGPVRLVREIGRGATGVVFHGHHTVLGRDVAVKFLINVTAGPGDADGVRRFVDEARAAAAVRHPGLTQVFHADLDGTTPYLVLEYVQGPTLRQLLDHAGHFTVPVATAVLCDVAASVSELHSRGIIHRDIKPSNVLVDKEGRVFVTDFGLALRRAHSVGHGQAAEIDFAGTPAYMAGEMFEGRVSTRSDVYAMGIMAFQLLTGATPFSGTFHELRDKHLREPLPAEALRGRGVKPEVVEVIERATNKQPMFRYKTAPDFARAFREAAGCGMPELARARKHLCDHVAARAVGLPPEAGGGAGGATAEVRLPYRSGAADDDSGSSLYTETISRIASVKRERRRHPADPEGSSTGSSGFVRVPGVDGAAAPPPPAGAASIGTPHAEPSGGAAGQTPAPAPGVAPPALAPPGVAARVVPGPVLSVAVLAIVYGTIAALWQGGVLLGAAANSHPTVPPPSAGGPVNIRVYLFLVPAAIAHATVAALFVLGGIACLKLKRWGRRLLVNLAAADLLLQAIVLLVALAWIEPATAEHLLAQRSAARGGGRAAVELSLATQWLLQWLVLSLFPAIALAVLTRRHLRDAFDAAASLPNPDEDEEPFF